MRHCIKSVEDKTHTNQGHKYWTYGMMTEERVNKIFEIRAKQGQKSVKWHDHLPHGVGTLKTNKKIAYNKYKG